MIVSFAYFILIIKHELTKHIMTFLGTYAESGPTQFDDFCNYF